MSEITKRADGTMAFGTTSLTVTVPSGVVDGDDMFLFLSHKSLAYATVPAAWTLVAQGISNTTRGEVYYRIASAEPASYSITGLSDTAAGVIKAFFGGLSSGLVEAFNVQTYLLGVGSTSFALGDIVTTGSDRLVLAMLAKSANSSTPPNFENGGELNDPPLYDASNQGGTNNGTHCYLTVAEGIKRISGHITDQTYSGAASSFDGLSSPNADGVVITLAVVPNSSVISSANRFYPTFRSPGTTLFGPPAGTWSPTQTHRSDRGIIHWRGLLSPEKAWSGKQYTLQMNGNGITNPEDIYGGAQNAGSSFFVTPRLAAQTLGGTIQLTFPVQTINPVGVVTAATYKLHVWASVGDDLTQVRGTLVNNYIDGGAWNTTLTWRQITAQSLSALTIQQGDRIIVEVGAHITTTPTAPLGQQIANIRFGGSAVAGTAFPDGPTSGTSNTGYAAYIDFSQALVLENETVTVPNAGQGGNSLTLDAANATVIGALPYSNTEDVTQVAAPKREVWYKWVSTFNGRIYATVWGSNYSASVKIYDDLTGSGNITGFSSQTQWGDQSAQGTCYSDVTSGTTYWFRVMELDPLSIAGLQSPANSGGQLTFNVYQHTAAATDDLVVNCQHITRMNSAGVPVVVQSDFFNNTPTGSAIDYSLTPLADLNGGFNTNRRVYTCLFSGSGDLEILDLDTLNVGQSEIDFIVSPFAIAPAAQQMASVVLDRNNNAYVGWFGDNYDVIGALSTPSACAIAIIPSSHGDNQAGAPFPAPTRFTAAQDVGGTDYVEVDAQNTTIYYTSSGTKIKRMATDGTQLADFATVPNAPGPRPGTRGLRILPPGDISGGMLVTNGSNVVRLDSSGTVIQTYVPSATNRAQDLDKVEITSDGTAFWVSDQYSASLFKFDLATGTQLADIWLKWPNGQLSGFSIVNGYRAGLATPLPVTSITVNVTGGVVVSGPDSGFGTSFAGGPSLTVGGFQWAIHRLDFKPRSEQSS